MSLRAAVTGVTVLVTVLLQPVTWDLAHAGWIPNGNPTGTTPWWAGDPSVAPDQSGGAFVASGFGICAGIQHFASTGDYAAGWPAAGLPTRQGDTNATVGDRHTRIVSDSAGGAYVVSSVWPVCVFCQSDPMYPLVQRLTGDGRVAPGWPDAGPTRCRSSRGLGRRCWTPSGSRA